MLRLRWWGFVSKNRRGKCGQSNIPRKATFMAPAHLMVFRRCSWRSFSVLSGREQKTERSPLVRRRNSHGEKKRKQTANGGQGQGLATGNYRARFQWRSTNLSRYLRFQPCSIISDQSRAVASSCSPSLCSPMSLKRRCV
jgi:hypothetical protein